MSKYIDAEKLTAEIERRIEETKSMKPSFDQFWAGQISAFKGVRTIITSLRQEQPEVDLKEIIEQTYHDGSVADTSDMDHVDYKNIASHFFELGRNARKEE